MSKTIDRLRRPYFAQLAVPGNDSLEYLAQCLSILNRVELGNFIIVFNPFLCLLFILLSSCPSNYGMISTIRSFLILSFNRKFVVFAGWTCMSPGELSLVYLDSSLNIIESLWSYMVDANDYSRSTSCRTIALQLFQLNKRLIYPLLWTFSKFTPQKKDYA